jgi:uncharacterized membrane protein (UPF0127 family)
VVARTWGRRLLGLALQRGPPAGRALLLPGCRSVHTFGMRFALDLVWLDADGRVLAIDEAVPPGRVRGRRDAAAVLEAPAGAGRLALRRAARLIPERLPERAGWRCRAPLE